jgi:hypothetical protein
VSSIESSIFTAGDYNALVADEKYTALLTHLFSHCSVVFVGYGLSEDYVLQLMVGSSELHQVFGDGPHFAILGSKRDHLPGSVKPILYLNEPHHDHRAAIRILEEIKHAREVSDVGLARRLLEPCHGSATALKSCHLISDFLPPGTWNVSHTLTLDRADGSKARVTVGHGFNAAEVPFTISTAIHDLAVGLLCFDLVYIPINAIGKLHEVLGFQMFWQLIKSESIRFIHWQSEEGVFVAGDDATIVGELKQIAVLGEHRLPRSTGEVIRRFLHPVDGKDTEAEALFQKLESNAVFISDAEIPDVGNLVKGLLLLPTIRRLLGFSDGILLDSLPQLADFSCPPASSACPARRHLSILGHFIGQAPFWR